MQTEMQTEQSVLVADVQFRASAGKTHGVGSTPGEALNDLLGRLGNAVMIPIVIRPFNRGDQYFTDAQQQRLVSLRSRLEELTPTEREEWEQLVGTSFDATIARAEAVQISH